MLQLNKYSNLTNNQEQNKQKNYRNNYDNNKSFLNMLYIVLVHIIKRFFKEIINVSLLVCLVNLENLNAHFIKENIDQAERLQKLNIVAIDQMKLLTNNTNIKKT